MVIFSSHKRCTPILSISSHSRLSFPPGPVRQLLQSETGVHSPRYLWSIFRQRLWQEEDGLLPRLLSGGQPLYLKISRCKTAEAILRNSHSHQSLGFTVLQRMIGDIEKCGVYDPQKVWSLSLVLCMKNCMSMCIVYFRKCGPSCGNTLKA